ncbi:MAG: DUF6544 family protein [Ferruginibacter sp.]
MTIVLFALIFFAIIIIFGKINLSIQFNREVKQLFSHSGNISNRTFTYEMLFGLPEPVQRYFKYILKDGQPYISYARITHDGQFKTGLEKPWVNIKGEQYATTGKPGFIWKGRTSMFMLQEPIFPVKC